RLPTEYGMTILISSHLLSEIDQIASTVGIITKGKMIFQDSIDVMRKFAQQKISLKVSDGERASRSLLAKGIMTEYKEGMILLSNQTDEKVAYVVHALVQDGFSIYRVEEEKSSLEDIFLQMTKEGAADDETA